MLSNLINEINACKTCSKDLLLGPNPIIRLSLTSKIIIVGQAPGRRVHETGIPWNDPSGEQLRRWMDVDCDYFYDASKVGIVPMGFCYPGKGKSGDLPPRKECLYWHKQLEEYMYNTELILLVGKYAQDYYLSSGYGTLTENVRSFDQFLPKMFPLPHPSPRNRIWIKKHPWFEQDVLPVLKHQIAKFKIE